jgi:NhaA family Na+:H+ antiporter
MRLANGYVIRLLPTLLRHDATKGVLLVACAAAALAMANGSWAETYQRVLALPVPVPGKPLTLVLFVNDFLMAIFFLLVGMELKRELTVGQLNSRARVMLPTLAALGGMAVPALTHAAFNRADTVALQGWAIPCATDIAFALGMLALLGNRVPTGLKVVLTALAVLDDLGAIVIIALFYGSGLSPWYLLGALLVFGFMGILNNRGVARVSVYLLLGLVMWWLMLKSGVHATIAGVATALAIPQRDAQGRPVMEQLEHQIAPLVNFVILPVFATMNAGVSFGEAGLGTLAHAPALGVATGLFAGKTIGVFGASWLTVKLRLGSLAEGVDWRSLFATSILCGIGFTMSIFIAELAFKTAPGAAPETAARAAELLNESKGGILLGSLVSAVAGVAALWFVLPRRDQHTADTPLD